MSRSLCQCVGPQRRRVARELALHLLNLKKKTGRPCGRPAGIGGAPTPPMKLAAKQNKRAALPEVPRESVSRLVVSV